MQAVDTNLVVAGTEKNQDKEQIEIETKKLDVFVKKRKWSTYE